MAEYGDYGRGGREVGHIYHTKNFDADRYDENGPEGEIFKKVMIWSLSRMEVTDSIVYASSDGAMVPDRLPDIIREDFLLIKKGILITIGAR